MYIYGLFNSNACLTLREKPPQSLFGSILLTGTLKAVPYEPQVLNSLFIPVPQLVGGGGDAMYVITLVQPKGKGYPLSDTHPPAHLFTIFI